MKHLYLKEEGVVHDSATSLLVGTWEVNPATGRIHVFLHTMPTEVRHERTATHESVMAEHRTLNHPHINREVSFNPITMRFNSRITM